jgi:hypothetical protein
MTTTAVWSGSELPLVPHFLPPWPTLGDSVPFPTTSFVASTPCSGAVARPAEDHLGDTVLPMPCSPLSTFVTTTPPQVGSPEVSSSLCHISDTCSSDGSDTTDGLMVGHAVPPADMRDALYPPWDDLVADTPVSWSAPSPPSTTAALSLASSPVGSYASDADIQHTAAHGTNAHSPARRTAPRTPRPILPAIDVGIDSQPGALPQQQQQQQQQQQAPPLSRSVLVSSPPGSVIDCDPRLVTEAARRQQKRLRNRESASLSRMRQKSRVTELEHENMYLREQVRSLQQDMASLRSSLCPRCQQQKNIPAPDMPNARRSLYAALFLVMLLSITSPLFLSTLSGRSPAPRITADTNAPLSITWDSLSLADLATNTAKSSGGVRPGGRVLLDKADTEEWPLQRKGDGFPLMSYAESSSHEHQRQAAIKPGSQRLHQRLQSHRQGAAEESLDQNQPGSVDIWHPQDDSADRAPARPLSTSSRREVVVHMDMDTHETKLQRLYGFNPHIPHALCVDISQPQLLTTTDTLSVLFPSHLLLSANADSSSHLLEAECRIVRRASVPLVLNITSPDVS